MKMDKTNPVFLEQEELEIIENKVFGIERLEAVKDLLLFSCYTGLAYIDAQGLRAENILLGIDRNRWIIKARVKTEVTSEIPILPEAEAILRKYKDHPLTKHGGLLPKISNQRYNSYLKEIADCCGIKKNITTHTGRHTFATTICAANGVPIETTGKMLGHTKLTTTQIYYKINRARISNDMTQLQQKMEERKIMIRSRKVC